MRKSLLIALSAAGLFLLNSTTASFAAEGKTEGKTVTITGEGKCAKCALKETDSCQNAIQVKEEGKTVTYYLAKNDVSKKFHEKICKAPAKVKATGTVKE